MIICQSNFSNFRKKERFNNMTHHNLALLIIDMQKGSFTPETPRHNTQGVVLRINELAQIFRQKNQPVFVVQHDGTGTGEFVKNTQEWENLEELDIKSTDIFIDKYANDAFYQSELKAVLLKNGITELFITGCATDFCVESTIQSALVHDFNITVVADAHTTGDRPHLQAEKVIEHYNWDWQNMISTEATIKVETTEQIIAAIL